MAISPADPRPIYRQIADEIADMITRGELEAGDRVPSTHELSAYHSVNPTTAAKALTELFHQGLVDKKRGLGMFVSASAREEIRQQRTSQFSEKFIVPLLREATALGLSETDVIALIKKERKL